MLINLQKKSFLLIIAVLLMSCSHQSPRPGYSSRDITPLEKEQIAKFSLSQDRTPADWRDSCVSVLQNFFKPKINNGVHETIAGIAKPIRELTQLNPEVKQFPNGKSYTLYRANVNVMNKYPDYDEFLEETAEILFEPNEPFGHIRLRIGKTLYSFNNVEWAQVSNFSPRMLQKSTNDEIPSPYGFVFQIGKEKIEATRKEIGALYESSTSHNIPPFDAYSPKLKIVETETTFGKSLKYETTSPKYGNSKTLEGKIIQENGTYMLDAKNGVKVPVEKNGNDYYTQSYSCSSSAGHVLKKFFGIDVSYDSSAKSLAQSLLKGNINENISPMAVIKYYEE